MVTFGMITPFVAFKIPENIWFTVQGGQKECNDFDP